MDTTTTEFGKWKVKPDSNKMRAMIKFFRRQAMWYHIVAALTLFSACFTAIAVAIFILPGYIISKLPDNMNSEKKELIIILMNGPLVFAIGAISYLTHLLVSVYRYSIKLYGHYNSHATILELIPGGTEIDLYELKKFLDLDNVTKYENPPTWGSGKVS